MDKENNEGHETADINFDAVASKHFKSTIPPHLLANLSEDERFLIEALSRLENGTSWLTENILTIQKTVTRLDNKLSGISRTINEVQHTLHDYPGLEFKVNKLWTWKQVISGKWAILWGIFILLVPTLFNFLLQNFFK